MCTENHSPDTVCGFVICAAVFIERGLACLNRDRRLAKHLPTSFQHTLG